MCFMHNCVSAPAQFIGHFEAKGESFPGAKGQTDERFGGLVADSYRLLVESLETCKRTDSFK